jgi:hypothetical protein
MEESLGALKKMQGNPADDPRNVKKKGANSAINVAGGNSTALNFQCGEYATAVSL